MGLIELVQRVPDRSAPARSGDDVDQARVLVRGTFFPDRIEGRAGRLLRITFRREETAACSERVVIPSLGRSVMLPPFEDVVLELAPLPPGQYEFGCSLGVLRGQIVVQSEPAHARLEVLGGRILVRGPATRGSVENPEPKAARTPEVRARRQSYTKSETSTYKEVVNMKRPTINITPAERIGRVFVGLVGVIGGLFLLGSASGAVIAALEVLLVLAGLDLVVTGALGHCPLYRKLGHTPPSLRKPA